MSSTTLWPKWFMPSLLLVLLLLAGCNQPKANVSPQSLNTVSLLPLARGPGGIATNPQTGYIYVVNESSHLSIFQNTELIATLPIGRQSTRHPIAVDVNRDRVYVVNERDNSLTIIQGTKVVATLDVAGQQPTDVAIGSKNELVYIVSGRSKELGSDGIPDIEGNVTVVDGKGEVIRTILLGKVLTKFITADPKDDFIYIGAVRGDVVVIQDLKEINRDNVGATVKAMDVDPRTGDVYVLARAANRDLNRFRKGKLIENTQVEGEGGSVDILKVHPVTGNIYVTDIVNQEVVVVRASDDEPMTVIGRVPAGRGPSKMAIDPKTENVYVTNIFDDSVTVIRGTDVLTTIMVGRYPYGIEVNPNNGWVYIANTRDHSITILSLE